MQMRDFVGALDLGASIIGKDARSEKRAKGFEKGIGIWAFGCGYIAFRMFGGVAPKKANCLLGQQRS